jgi:hypothetical protein
MGSFQNHYLFSNRVHIDIAFFKKINKIKKYGQEDKECEEIKWGTKMILSCLRTKQLGRDKINSERISQAKAKGRKHFPKNKKERIS